MKSAAETKNPSAMYNSLSKVLRWTKHGAPQSLTVSGSLLNKPVEIMTAMNEYFINKIQLINAGFRHAISDLLLKLKEKTGYRSSQHGVLPVMQTDLITDTEVLETLKKMKPSNVCGEDDISINMIKDTADILLPVLTKI